MKIRTYQWGKKKKDGNLRKDAGVDADGGDVGGDKCDGGDQWKKMER